MKRPLGLLVLMLLVLAQLGVGAPAAAQPSNAPAKPIPGRYIVTLKDGAKVPGFLKKEAISALYVYEQALNGFAADLSQGQLKALQRNADVVAIEQDQEVLVDATQTIGSGGAWGIDRIDERTLPLSGSYTYTRNGSGVNAYIIDTGIATSHADFGGRASNVYDAFGGNGQDCNGHGTHVAGTVGGATYGVAKGVRLYGVRVLNCQGSGSYSGIIAGIDWVARNRVNPAVANMSLGGGYSSSVNTATTNLVNSGVFVAVAAGNENQNSCNVSPASAASAYTTAASDRNDTRASFSNYGSCVDGYAPGVAIKSTWLNGGTNTISGTSMASPHVAGIAALYKANYGNASASTIVSWLNSNATTSVIKSNVSGTPNRLVYMYGL